MLSNLWWPRRRRKQRELSQYSDGELGPQAADTVAERLVFESEARLELARLRAVDALVERVLGPSGPLPDPEDAADAVVARVHAADLQSTPAARSRWTPAVIASAGILLTAGVAFAGLKRRGLV